MTSEDKSDGSNADRLRSRQAFEPEEQKNPMRVINGKVGQK